MRITLVAASLDPEHGGPTEATRQLAEHLRTQGNDLTVIATDFTSRGRVTAKEKLAWSIDGVPIYWCRTHSPRLVRMSMSQLWHILRFGRESDVLHVHGFYLWHSLATALAARITNTPFTIHAHGAFEPYDQLRSSLKKRIYDVLVGRWILKSAAALLVDTEIEAASLPKWVTRRVASIDVVPLGGVTTVSTAPDDRADSLDNPKVLFLARISRKKRLDLAIAAFDNLCVKHPTAQFLIAGSDNERLLDEYLENASVRSRQNIRCEGFVTGDHKASLLRGAHVYILASENENFGISVAEAMAAGTPVVVTDQVAIHDEIESSGAGLVAAHPASHVDLGDLLTRVLQDRDAWVQMSLAASALARDKYSWEASSKEFLVAIKKARDAQGIRS